MLKNYLLIALRNFQRNKIFSLIHVLGLSIGLSASIVIFLIAKHEFSFDKVQQNGDRIFRIVMDLKFNGSEGHSAAVPAPLSKAVELEVTGVDAVIPVMQFQGDGTVGVSIDRLGARQPTVFKKQREVIFTNDKYFQLLPFVWLAGDGSKALSNPFSTVVTAARAKQYFPGIPLNQVVGKEIVYNNELRTFITGVVEDVADASDFTSVEFISYATISETRLQDNFMMNTWNDWMAYSKVYVILQSQDGISSVENQLAALLQKYNKEANKDASNTWTYKLQPLHDIHFNTTYASFGQRTANENVLYGLMAIASFLLILACINFINLSTAQAGSRAKEIGIRKTSGSMKSQLVAQFLVETFCITLIATVVSIGLSPLLLQQFGDFIPAGVKFDAIYTTSSVSFLIALAVGVSLLSGLYPSMILSALQPIQALRSRPSNGTSKSYNLRKVLTVGQFVIAQFFIVGAFMVSKQIHYSISQDLGYRKEAIINFELPRDTVDHRERLNNQITNLQGVEKASIGFLPPAIEGSAFSNITYHNGKEEIKTNVQIRWGDPNFLPLYNIGLISGRNIGSGKDISEAVINESYAKALGFTDISKAVGEQLNASNRTLQIVGIMRDFHEGSTHSPIGPLVFRSGDDGNFVHIALAADRESRLNWKTTIGEIEKVYQENYPGSEFNYSFFDQTIANFYRQEQHTSTLLNWAMALSITISCLGLLGLVIYTSETRKKEIGIRKVLGASVTRIVALLSKEFIQLVVIAFVLSVPIAWFAIERWLEAFVYKTEISWWVFLGSGSLLLAVAIITLSLKTITTARSNPVDSLRSE